MTNEQLLAEIEDVLRTMPPRPTIRHETEENISWIGRASAVIGQWNPAKAQLFEKFVADFYVRDVHTATFGLRKMLTQLHEARHDLRMRTIGPLSVAISKGQVFDYFDEIRKLIETARQDLLFVDPYLDAEFVSRYLPHVVAGVTVRLLAREKLPSLLPAVHAFATQSNLSIAVRSAPNFHDRYVIVDRTLCYQSGASFKDGAKQSPTTLTQITDAFTVVQQTYETLWTGGRIERSP